MAKYSLIAYQKTWFGSWYDKLDMHDIAEEYFMEAIQLYNTHEGLLQSEKIAALNEISKFYLKQRDFSKAKFYAEEALELEKKIKFPAVRETLYKTMASIEMKMGDKAASESFLELSRVLSDSLEIAKRTAVNTGVSNILGEKQSVQEAAEKKVLKIILFGVLAAAALFSVLWYLNTKKIRRRYEAIISGLQSQGSLNEEETLVNTDVPIAENMIINILESEEEQQAVNLGIQKETLDELLVKLEKFEESGRFIKPEVNLVYLCNYLGTNTKYLSYILKYNKKKTFNKYINDLRIDYLIKKMYDDPKYLDYKIEYLGESVGFQSRSAFNNSFKKRTGLTPSYFIKRLKEDKVYSEIKS